MALLNLRPDSHSHMQFKLLVQLFTAAKQTLAKSWKSPKLVLHEAIAKMNYTMTQAKMAAFELDMIPKFERMWQPWIAYIMPTLDNRVLLPW